MLRYRGLQCIMARVVNMTCTFELNSNLDLKLIADKIDHAQYSKVPFNVTRIKLNNPKGTAMIYKNGKVVVVGCSSLENVRTIANTLDTKMKLLGYLTDVKSLQVRNIVGAVDLKRTLKVCDGVHASYEPELFPGMMMPLSYNIQATFFKNGKVFMTGATSIEDLDAAYVELLLKLE